MKTAQLSIIFILFSTLTACATQTEIEKQGKNPIPQITDIDLQYASAKAKSNNRTLMIVYNNENCATCKEWLVSTLEKQATDKMLNQFEIKNVSMQKGIEVVCPSGIELDNEEFYEAKGIEGDLSIVFHNDIGEVVYTYNEQPSDEDLNALLQYIKLHKYEDRIDFDEWKNRQG